jgi:Zn-dependent peptidase ImmA (M78 family)
MTSFRRGFKTWCENTAAGFRRDLNLPADSALDPRALAQHLKIVVWTPNDVVRLGNLAQTHCDQLLIHDESSWSAVTLVLPSRKIIIVNSSHSPVRQNSDIMHELAHLILEHEPARVDMTSERLMILDTYNKVQEEEADWLSGALLVPRDALLERLKRDPRDDYAASHFNVSKPMIVWRRQVTGIDIQLRRRSPR